MSTARPPAPNGHDTNFYSSGLRQRVDQLMKDLYSGGVNNPMDSIEQLSYLVFLRLLSERDDIKAAVDKKYERVFSGDWAKLAWGNFVTLTGDQLFKAVRDAMEKLQDLPGLSATGKLLFRNATLKIHDRPTLRAVVQGINVMDLASHEGIDLKGDMYEYLLSKIAQSGTNGQFRTPHHIIDLIVALVDPQPGQRLCDPTVGTAGFLISAYKHILRSYTKPADLARGLIDGSMLKPAQWKFLEEHAFTGYDNDANMVKLAILNLYLHQLEKARIEFFNPLTTTFGGQYPGQLYDIILANPPFSGSLQKESVLADIDLDTRETSLLFLKWFVDHLAQGGRAGVIVPQGALTDMTGAAKRVRKLLLTNCTLLAVVNLPTGSFRPYADAETAALIFEGGKRHADVWMYELHHDGLSPDDRRAPIPENDIPDLLARWPTRAVSPQSLVVPVRDIERHGMTLALGEYRSIQRSSDRARLPRGWRRAPLSEIVEETDLRAGSANVYPVLSVTKHRGFVESHKYFRKRVFSDDTSQYKVVRRGEFAYSTIHIDEGAIGFLEDPELGVISPMYKTFRIKAEVDDVDVRYLYALLKSSAMMRRYRDLGKGSVKRRKSVTFETFSSLVVPIPPSHVQDEIATAMRTVSSLEHELERAKTQLLELVERTVGTSE